MLAPFGNRMLAAATLRPGETVLDIGCGTGSTTLAARRAVKATGAVLGIDVSPMMLAAARRRLSEHQTKDSVTFVLDDAAVYGFARGTADVAISRFGVGHFSNPTAAFTNLHRALRPGGRLVFTEWAARENNEWMTLVEDLADQVLGHLDGHHRADHNRHFASLSGVQTTLTNAGFHVHATAVSEDMHVGHTVEATSATTRADTRARLG